MAPPARTDARSLRRTVAVVLVVAVVIGAVIAYVLASFAFAATRIGGADRTLNTVISHQNSLNKKLNDVDTAFSTLSSNSTYNPTQAKAAVDLWVAGSRSASTTIDQDDAALMKAASSLNDLPWLTTLSRSNLDREARRLALARKALASARTVAADYLLDGQFWEAFISSTQDLDTVIAAAGGGDWTTAKTTLAQMKVDVDNALQASSAPGLPPELHAAMADFEVFVADYGKLVDASQAGDDARISTATTAVQADAARIGAYNFDTIAQAINAYYKPLIDAFNSQLAQATA